MGAARAVLNSRHRPAPRRRRLSNRAASEQAPTTRTGKSVPRTLSGMDTRRAWGTGLATCTAQGRTLAVWFPEPSLGDPPPGSAGPYGVPADLAALAEADPDRAAHHQVRRVAIDLDEPPTSAEDAYLRLHLLSHRLARPNTVNLEGIFGVLPTVVWTSAGPFATTNFERTRLAVLTGNPQKSLQVYGVDKFPRMTDFVVPSGVRIADADRVRLGAYLAEGTTVMHEGFVNFNAGTLGPAMVEGRTSQGVVVGEGTDIGGGASIMGTLSGGGAERIRVGRRCLLGANCGIGISLGDECVIEAGLYVTAGTKVAFEGRTVKAESLSGEDGLLFRRNSTTGKVEALRRSGEALALNAALHT